MFLIHGAFKVKISCHQTERTRVTVLHAGPETFASECVRNIQKAPMIVSVPKC